MPIQTHNNNKKNNLDFLLLLARYNRRQHQQRSLNLCVSFTSLTPAEKNEKRGFSHTGLIEVLLQVDYMLQEEGSC